MDMLEITVLGGFQARIGPATVLRLPPKAQALLAYLALRPGQAHPRDKAAALLWGDAAQEQARASLRQTIAVLRRALGSVPAMVVDGPDLAVDRTATAVDVVSFEKCLAEATPEALEHAAGLYRGDLLEGLEVDEPAFEEWLAGERERLREAAIEALAKLLAHHDKAGATEKAIRTALRLLALDGLQEPVHRVLMRLYVRQGRRGAALKQYQTCLALLQRELGAEPEAATKQLYREILRQQAGDGHAFEPPRRARGGRRASSPPELDAAAPQLIGRETELERLRACLRQAARGQGNVIAVVGEAGLGKSALVTSFAAEATREARVLIGRSYETEQVLAFGPWIGALRTAGLTADSAVLEKLEIGVRAELARVLPELGPYEGQSGAAGEEQLRLFASLARVLTDLAADMPLVMLLEDVHWADESSLRFLAFLARRIHDRKMLIVVTGRTEELATAPVLRHVVEELSVDPRWGTLTLAPLSRADTARLVGSFARAGTDGGTIAALSERVWSLSEGNPLVVVETMRAVGEGGIAMTPTALSLPERVRRMVSGRLGRLTEPARQLVAVAAIIGREFEFRLLQRAAGMSERETADAAEELVRRCVLHGVGDRIDFTHDRIREIAHQEILSSRRIALHASVAEALEDLAADHLEDYYTALARHYREAEIWPKAVTYLRHAGAQAQVRSAYRDAATSFQHAIDALRHLPERPDTLALGIDLRFDLRRALQPLGRFPETRRLLEEAREAAERLDDARRRGWVAIYLAHYFQLSGDLDAAIVHGERALSIARALSDLSLLVTVNFFLGGRIRQARGEHRAAIERLLENIAAIDGEHLHQCFGTTFPPAVASRMALATGLAELGRFEEARRYAEDGMRIAEDIGEPLSRVIALLGLGLVAVQRGDVTAAIEVLEPALELAREWSLEAWVHRVMTPLVAAYAGDGRADDALALLAEVPEHEQPSGLTELSLRLAHLAEACLLIGRGGMARELATRGLDLACRHGERGGEAWNRYVLGRIAGERDDASRCYEEALRLAESLDMRPLAAHCHAALGTVLARAGQVERARAELSSGIAMYASMEMRLWRATAEVTLASLSGR